LSSIFVHYMRNVSQVFVQIRIVTMKRGMLMFNVDHQCGNLKFFPIYCLSSDRHYLTWCLYIDKQKKIMKVLTDTIKVMDMIHNNTVNLCISSVFFLHFQKTLSSRCWIPIPSKLWSGIDPTVYKIKIVNCKILR